MNILDRYFIGTVISYSALVLGVLMSLSGLFVFIDQQEDIGKGTYGTADALLFTLLNIPQQVFELMPIAVLLGALLGLGALARGSELVVVRASGVSVARVGLSVALGGILLAVLTGLIGEFIAPSMQKFARQQKMFSTSGNINIAGGGVWVKDGNTMINVAEQSGDNLFGGVFVFQFDTPQQLAGVARAERATVMPDGRHWQLQTYASTRFEEDRVVSRQARSETLAADVDPEVLGLAASKKPGQLPSMDLLRLIGHLEANGLKTDAYEFAFWSRLARTCAIVIVALLAVPFVFGPLRSSGSGARLLIGVLLGVGFFLLQRTVESGAIVFNLNPIALAWLPTALLAGLTGVLIANTR
jgi:lipopolysaccharide export system permease protein